MTRFQSYLKNQKQERSGRIIADEQNQPAKLRKTSSHQMKKLLTPDQKKYLQAWSNFNHVNRELTHFWTTVPRDPSGSVDWKQVTESEMEAFQQLKKRSKNYLGVISTLEAAGVDKEPIMKLLRLENSLGINL